MLCSISLTKTTFSTRPIPILLVLPQKSNQIEFFPNAFLYLLEYLYFH